MIVVRLAHAGDWPAVERLLIQHDLPLEGAQDHLGSFFVAHVAGGLVGCAGLEVHGKVGLLRSVAVESSSRGAGVGSTVFRAVLDQAHLMGLTHVYLLTTTAASYFARHGFLQVERATAPTELHASEEFRGACPASATLMVIPSQ